MKTYVVATTSEYTVIVVATSGQEAIAIAKSMYTNKWGTGFDVDDLSFYYYPAEEFFGKYGAREIEFVD